MGRLHYWKVWEIRGTQVVPNGVYGPYSGGIRQYGAPPDWGVPYVLDGRGREPAGVGILGATPPPLGHALRPPRVCAWRLARPVRNRGRGPGTCDKMAVAK